MKTFLVATLLFFGAITFLPSAEAVEQCKNHSDEVGWSSDCVGAAPREGPSFCVYHRTASGYYDTDGERVTVFSSYDEFCTIPITGLP